MDFKLWFSKVKLCFLTKKCFWLVAKCQACLGEMSVALILIKVIGLVLRHTHDHGIVEKQGMRSGYLHDYARRG